MNQFQSLFATLFFISATVIVSCNQDKKKAESQPVDASSVSPIEGSWVTVSADGKITQFKMFNDGFFSLIMQDSLGKWSMSGAGSYSLDGNTYKETFRYCSVPDYVGATDWQEYELKGDTLYFKGFTKVMYADGSDK
ncbi:MAG: hypothetical protein H7X79_04595, partial [Sporomusaceae bacterium]|nr:hypothetical protein [Sporomusaceae bacterium]